MYRASKEGRRQPNTQAKDKDKDMGEGEVTPNFEYETSDEEKDIVDIDDIEGEVKDEDINDGNKKGLCTVYYVRSGPLFIGLLLCIIIFVVLLLHPIFISRLIMFCFILIMLGGCFIMGPRKLREICTLTDKYIDDFMDICKHRVHEITRAGMSPDPIPW